MTDRVSIETDRLLSNVERPLESARGWIVVAAAFVSTFTVFGVAYSFGAFFRPMAVEFGSGRAATSLVFALTAFAYFGLGSISGRVADAIGPRRVLLFGAVAMGIGLAITSRVQSLGAGYAAYAGGVGIGVACGYVPMVAAVGKWFDRRRGAALGIAVAGIGVGTLVVAPVAAALIDAHGWRTTYLVFAAASFVLLTACAVVTTAPPGPAETVRPVLELVRTRAFASLYGSGFLMSLALFVPFVYLPAYAVREGISSVSAAALVGIIGGASVIGRLVLGALADRLGRVRTYQACFAVMGLSFGIWLAATTFPALVVYAVVMGVGYGGFIALSPAVTAELFGPQGLGGVLGLMYTSAAFGALIGPPAAGLLIDASGYPLAIAVAGALALASFVALLPVKPGAET